MYEMIISEQWEAIYLHAAVWAAVVFVAWVSVAVACFVDMWSGVTTARALGEKVHSHRLRETIGKVKDYTNVLLAFLFIDLLGSLFTWYQLPFFQMIIAVGAMLIEGWSVIENKKRKKSHAGIIPELAAEIVKCAREKDAEAIIDNIEHIIEKGEQGERVPENGEKRTHNDERVPENGNLGTH